MARAKSGRTLNVADDTEVEFRHDNGLSFGGTYKTFEELYKPAGYELVKRADDQPLYKTDADNVPESTELPPGPEGPEEEEG